MRSLTPRPKGRAEALLIQPLRGGQVNRHRQSEIADLATEAPAADRCHDGIAVRRGRWPDVLHRRPNAATLSASRRPVFVDRILKGCQAWPTCRSSSRRRSNSSSTLKTAKANQAQPSRRRCCARADRSHQIAFGIVDCRFSIWGAGHMNGLSRIRFFDSQSENRKSKIESRKMGRFAFR